MLTDLTEWQDKLMNSVYEYITYSAMDFFKPQCWNVSEITNSIFQFSNMTNKQKKRFFLRK